MTTYRIIERHGRFGYAIDFPATAKLRARTYETLCWYTSHEEATRALNFHLESRNATPQHSTAR